MTSLAVTLACIGIIVGLVWIDRHTKFRLWIEVWRNPELAFVLMCRDPSWMVSDKAPSTLTRKHGWIGPIRMRMGSLIFGVYIDNRDTDEAIERIRMRLINERKLRGSKAH